MDFFKQFGLDDAPIGISIEDPVRLGAMREKYLNHADTVLKQLTNLIMYIRRYKYGSKRHS